MLSHGLLINNVSCNDFSVSDHKCILFRSIMQINQVGNNENFVLARIFNSTSASKFTDAFTSSPLHVESGENVDSLLNIFNNTCIKILDKIAPFKQKQAMAVQPWLTDTLRALKRECRRAERKWKASKLSVHFEILKNFMHTFNSEVKRARAKYFSDLIDDNRYNSRTLFSVINRVTEAPSNVLKDTSPEKCEEFLKNFYQQGFQHQNAYYPPSP